MYCRVRQVFPFLEMTVLAGTLAIIIIVIIKAVVAVSLVFSPQLNTYDRFIIPGRIEYPISFETSELKTYLPLSFGCMVT